MSESSAHRSSVRNSPAAIAERSKYRLKNAARREPEARANRRRKILNRQPPTPTNGRHK